MVQEWRVCFRCFLLHLAEVVYALLLLDKARNSFTKIVPGTDVFGVFLAEFRELIAAFPEPSQAVQGLGFAPKGFVGLRAWGNGIEIAQRCIPLIDLEEGQAPVVQEVMLLFLCRRTLQSFGVTIIVVSVVDYRISYWDFTIQWQNRIFLG